MLFSFSLSSQLLLFLQEFSQKMIAKTSDLEKQVDGLVNEAKSTDSRVHNVFNDFLMLANTQFIENVSGFISMCMCRKLKGGNCFSRPRNLKGGNRSLFDPVL